MVEMTECHPPLSSLQKDGSFQRQCLQSISLFLQPWLWRMQAAYCVVNSSKVSFPLQGTGVAGDCRSDWEADSLSLYPRGL